MRQKRVRGADGRMRRRKRVFRSIEEYERLTARSPYGEDVDEFAQAVEQETGLRPDIVEEPGREGEF